MTLTANGITIFIADRYQAQKPVPPVHHLQQAFDAAVAAFEKFQDAMSAIPDEQWDPSNSATGTGDRGIVPFPSPPIELLERGLDMLDNTFQAYKSAMAHTNRQVDVQRQRPSESAMKRMSKKPIDAHNQPKLPVRGEPVIVPRFGEMTATAMEGPSSMSVSDPSQSGKPYPMSASSPSLAHSGIGQNTNTMPSKSPSPSQIKPAAEKMGKKPGEKSGTKLPQYLRTPRASNVAAATVQEKTVEPTSEVTRGASSGPKVASSTSGGKKSRGPPSSAASKKATSSKATGRVNKGNGSAEAPSKSPKDVAISGKNTGRVSQSDAINVSSPVDQSPGGFRLAPYVSEFTNFQNTDNAPYISPYANPPNTDNAPYISPYATRQDTGDITHQSPYTNPHDTSSGRRGNESSAYTAGSSTTVKPTAETMGRTTGPRANSPAERPISNRATLAAMFAPSGREEEQRARPAKRAGEESEEGKLRGEKKNPLYARRW